MSQKFLSENAQAVLGFLQANGDKKLIADEIAEGVGLAPRSVNGTITGLQKKGFVKREEVEGFEKKVVLLTPAGIAFDPAAELPE